MLIEIRYYCIIYDIELNKTPNHIKSVILFYENAIFSWIIQNSFFFPSHHSKSIQTIEPEAIDMYPLEIRPIKNI